MCAACEASLECLGCTKPNCDCIGGCVVAADERAGANGELIPHKEDR